MDAPNRKSLLSRRGALHALALLGVCCLTLEVASRLAFDVIAGISPDEAERIRALRLASLEQEFSGSEGGGTDMMFHPYLGYLGRPGGGSPYVVGDGRPQFNDFGLLSVPGHRLPYRKRGNELVIAVLGGSVADIFANTSETFLGDALRALDPAFDREVVLISLAVGGYKQPQQLIQLQYALLLGFDFDLVLNLDGFNDIALAGHNAVAGSHPIYPSTHHTAFLTWLGAGGNVSPEGVARMGEYYDVLRSERRLLRLAEWPVVGHSAFVRLLAARFSLRAMDRARAIQTELLETAQRSLRQELRGPPRPRPRNPYPFSARVWYKASLMLDSVCKRFELPYLHVLQPNQYVQGSKPLSSQEQQRAVLEGHPWGLHARRGYRALRLQGARLKEAGVAFHDFTQIFSDHPETLYTDDCCHFGARGNQILAENLAAILQERFRDRL
ncbi:MAG: hypothetical protein MJE66_06305 [Proteobacteria bacterium]|nr:hypothetical protein [Pseudomonadota bacterium]